MRKVLDQIYEWRFYDFSYGFRKGRNYHQAIREINQKVMTKKVNFVVENFEFMVYNKVKDLSKHSKMLSFLKKQNW